MNCRQASMRNGVPRHWRAKGQPSLETIDWLFESAVRAEPRGFPPLATARQAEKGAGAFSPELPHEPAPAKDTGRPDGGWGQCADRSQTADAGIDYSVLRRMFDVIGHQDVDWTLGRCQFEPELFLQSLKKRWSRLRQGAERLVGIRRG